MQDRFLKWPQLMSMADAEVERVRQALPAELAGACRELGITYERVPPEGIPGDTLGLFVGLPFNETESGAMDLPPQVILYLRNLWDYAGQDTAIYREEVRRTFLHELGHYLGLDEGDLEVRGLE